MASLFDDVPDASPPLDPWDSLFRVWWAVYAEAIRPVPMRDKAECWAAWKRARWTVLQQKALIVKLQAQAALRRQCKDRREFCPRLPDPKRYLKRKLWKEELG